MDDMKFSTPLQNEKGMALVIAMLLLAVMSILGTIMLSGSTTEIQLSGNYRNSYQSFHTADRAIEYSIGGVADGVDTVDLYNDSDTTVVPNVTHLSRISSPDGLSSLEVSAVTATDDRNSVVFLSATPPPAGSGSDATKFEARNYAISAVGVYPATANNPSRVALRAQVAKIVPK